MVAMVMRRPGEFVRESFPVPTVEEDTGLLRVDLVGVCATDIKYLKGSLATPLPIILGHEIVGTIVDAGKGFLARNGVTVGDRVALEATMRCGRCRLCQTGRGSLCEQRRSYGNTIGSDEPPHLWGGYSQYLHLAPQAVVHRLPPDMLPEVGVLLGAVIANGIEWVNMIGGARVGDRVVIQGVGQQGLSAIAAARESGAGLVIATGRSVDRERFLLARRFGVDATVNVDEQDPVAAVRDLTDGAMVDLVVDVTGNPQALAASIRMLRPGGTLISAGTTGTETLTPLPMDTVLYNGLTIRGVFSKSTEAVHRAVALAQSPRYPFMDLVTHRFPLARAAEAIRTLAREVPGENPVKVVIDPWA